MCGHVWFPLKMAYFDSLPKTSIPIEKIDTIDDGLSID